MYLRNFPKEEFVISIYMHLGHLMPDFHANADVGLEIMTITNGHNLDCIFNCEHRHPELFATEGNY